MPRAHVLAKLAKAARLLAESQRLTLEALEELAAQPDQPPAPLPPEITPEIAARARRTLRRLGAPK